MKIHTSQEATGFDDSCSDVMCFINSIEKNNCLCTEMKWLTKQMMCCANRTVLSQHMGVGVCEGSVLVETTHTLLGFKYPILSQHMGVGVCEGSVLVETTHTLLGILLPFSM